MGDEGDARDVVQSACVRAIKYFQSLKGDDGRAWFLGIVRNACYSALTERSGHHAALDIEDVMASGELEALGGSHAAPDALMEKRATRNLVNATLQQLPPVFREVLVLREMEELSYDEIANIVGVPIGTVMSRLSRARAQFRVQFADAERGVEGD